MMLRIINNSSSNNNNILIYIKNEIYLHTNSIYNKYICYMII